MDGTCASTIIKSWSPEYFEFVDYIQSKAICTHNFNINFTVVDCTGDLTEEDQCKACSGKFWESGECKGILKLLNCFESRTQMKVVEYSIRKNNFICR